jgi:hypothetical protein
MATKNIKSQLYSLLLLILQNERARGSSAALRYATITETCFSIASSTTARVRSIVRSTEFFCAILSGREGASRSTRKEDVRCILQIPNQAASLHIPKLFSIQSGTIRGANNDRKLSYNFSKGMCAPGTCFCPSWPPLVPNKGENAVENLAWAQEAVAAVRKAGLKGKTQKPLRSKIKGNV